MPLACRTRPATGVDLRLAERSVFSPSGEDGVLEQIFEMLPPTHKFLVDLGAGDGINGSSSRNLIANHAWEGLLIETQPEKAAALADNCQSLRNATALQTLIDPGDIEIILERHGVPHDLDLLIIGLKANDWYVWRGIWDFRPQVVQIQYNAAFVPPQRMVIEYHPFNYWDGGVYFGASLQSLYNLGKRKGYELVYANQGGTNLFFVDRRLFARLGLQDNSPTTLYRRCQALPAVTPGLVRTLVGADNKLPGTPLETPAVVVPRRYVLNEF